MTDLSSLRSQILVALGLALASCSSPAGPDATVADATADTTSSSDDSSDVVEDLDAEDSDAADDGTPWQADLEDDAKPGPGICVQGMYAASVKCYPVGSGQSPEFWGENCFPPLDIGPETTTPDADELDDIPDAVSMADADSEATDPDAWTDLADGSTASDAAAETDADGGSKRIPSPPPPNGYPVRVPDGCAPAKYFGGQYDNYEYEVTYIEVKDGQCCYTICSTGSVCGRPLHIGAAARTASLVSRSDWAHSAAELPAADPQHLSALAAAWRADALEEHASIASFQRFGLELMAFGAPPELVTASLQAAADEVRHASLCFGLATQLDGVAQGPSQLDLSGLELAPNLQAAVAAAIAEGCVGETIAAAHAGAAARATRDPALGAVLERIAADESRHAQLAWQFVRWACETGGAAVRAQAAASFAAALAAPPQPRAADRLVHGVPDPELRRWGRLPEQTGLALTAAVLAQVVGPCAQQLLTEWPVA